jgi:hypothetical protein
MKVKVNYFIAKSGEFVVAGGRFQNEEPTLAEFKEMFADDIKEPVAFGEIEVELPLDGGSL